MEFRAAKPMDATGIVALGLEALRMDADPLLVISEERVCRVTRECISNPGDFVWVAVQDGKIVASVAAMVTDMLFHERRQANVIQFYSQVPGAGMPLLRELVKWYRSRPVLKLLLFTLEHRADPRIGKLLRRLGLQVELPVYALTR